MKFDSEIERKVHMILVNTSMKSIDGKRRAIMELIQGLLQEKENKK